MIDLRDIVPLTDFQRNPKQLKQRMKKSGRPVVLTVNGRAAFVLQDVAAYQKELEQLHIAEEIRAAEQEFAEGKGIPLSEVIKEAKSRYGIQG